MSLIIDLDAEPMWVDPDGDDAAEWLGRLARDVPPDVDTGRVLAARWDPREACMNFVTTAGLFSSYHAHSERVVRLGVGPDQMTEWTSWVGGRETDRYARRTADLQP